MGLPDELGLAFGFPADTAERFEKALFYDFFIRTSFFVMFLYASCAILISETLIIEYEIRKR